MDEAEKHYEYYLRNLRMITVEQLKEMPNNQGVGGFAMTISKIKKLTQIGNNWIHQIVLADETGEILADVKIGTQRIPLQRNQQIKIIVAKVQDIAEGGKKLYVDQSAQVTASEPDMLDKEGLIQEIRSKIMCWQVAAYLQAGNDSYSAVEFSKSDELKEIVDNIMKG